MSVPFLYLRIFPEGSLLVIILTMIISTLLWPVYIAVLKTNPKMWWYSASAWEHHSLKHLKENLHIHPDDPKFSQQFACAPEVDAIPSTSIPRQNLPHKEVIRKWAEASKQFFKRRMRSGRWSNFSSLSYS